MYQSPDLYYLHGDHLGTATFVTNSQSQATQFFLNLPFGETMIEQMDGSYDNPFKFNAKELDEDTGLYYYGARYYNPRLSIWYGVDPLAEKYPEISPYVYTANNPVKYIDPDGRKIIFVTKKGIQLQYRNGNFQYLNGERKGQIYDGRKHFTGSKSLFKLAQSYRKIEKSGDKDLKNMLHHLEKSDNKHVIQDGKVSEVNINRGYSAANYPGDGTSTTYNLGKEANETFEKNEGLSTTDFATTVHEMRHQFDHDIENAFDDKYEDRQTARSTNEQRAVKEENKARKVEGLKERTTYGKQKVNPNPPNYILPKN